MWGGLCLTLSGLVSEKSALRLAMADDTRMNSQLSNCHRLVLEVKLYHWCWCLIDAENHWLSTRVKYASTNVFVNFSNARQLIIVQHQPELYIVCYTITKSMHTFWLVNQLWFIVPVNPWKNRAPSELLYNSKRPAARDLQILLVFYQHPGWFISL